MEQAHPDWHQATHFLLGYGSLLSADSRLRFSDNPHPAICVTVKGFQRAWITRAFHEQQTYVGAMPDSSGEINAHCIPITINPSLQTREQDYRFVEVDHKQVLPNGCQNTELWHHVEHPQAKLWICESLQRYPASKEYPIHQTYVDTCLSGCLHHYRVGTNITEQGIKEARRFIATTQGWQHLLNDRETQNYPRAARLIANEHVIIDQLLSEFGCIKERQSI